jgi:hypothetical protein
LRDFVAGNLAGVPNREAHTKGLLNNNLYKTN